MALFAKVAVITRKRTFTGILDTASNLNFISKGAAEKLTSLYNILPTSTGTLSIATMAGTYTPQDLKQLELTPVIEDIELARVPDQFPRNSWILSRNILASFSRVSQNSI